MNVNFLTRCFNFVFRPKTWQAYLVLALLLGFTIFIFGFGYLDEEIKFLNSEVMSFAIGPLKFTVYELITRLTAIIIIFWGAHFIASWIQHKLVHMHSIRSSSRALLIKIFQIILYFIAFITTLWIIELDLSALTIFGGAIGIGVGFGLQKIASNFISGLILLFEGSIEEGSLVEIEAGKLGIIRNTRARYTLIETLDGKEVMMPNEEFITNRVVNWTFSHTSARFEINITVASDADIHLVKKLMLEAAMEHPLISKDKLPRCLLADIGEPGMKFLLQYWMEDVLRGKDVLKSDLLFSIWGKFLANGVKLPYQLVNVKMVEKVNNTK